MTTATPDHNPTILAVGAAGQYAGLVVPALAERGARVRGLVQHQAQGPAVLRRGAAEIAVGDLTDAASLDAALAGVDAVFYIAPAAMPDQAAVGQRVVAAAKRAGVRRFVFSSAMEPVVSAIEMQAAKVPVEAAVIESGMEFAILEPTIFFQNIAQSWPSVVKTGEYAEPWSADNRFARVDYRDVAEVAAIALTEDRLLYGTYQLCAEGSLNRHELAALMGDVLGRTITAGDIDPAKVAGPPGPDGRPSAMQQMITWYDQHDLRGNELVLRAILGREPRTLRAYLAELAAAPQPGAAPKSASPPPRPAAPRAVA